MNRKARVFWIIIFIVLIFVVSKPLYTHYGSSGGFNLTWKNLQSRVASFISGSKYSGPDILTRQEIVQEESSIIDVVELVSPSVVSVVVRTINFDRFSGPSFSDEGIGTGFIVDRNGLIVTNSHVVDNPEGEYSVVLKDGRSFEVEKVHLDEPSDLAILEITARDLPIVTLGDSDNLRVGQQAIAIGNALGRFQNTVTTGVISGVTRELQASAGYGDLKTYENAIQTDAALNPGNSGGPLLNSSGQVIGINVATAGADNISFAIPVNNLKPILEGFIKEGRIIRPYLGVTYTMISKEIANLRRLPEGAFVSRVVPESPAFSAGLARGDIIKKINDTDLSSQSSLSSILSKLKVGDTVNMVVDREGKDISLKAVLAEAPDVTLQD